MIRLIRWQRPARGFIVAMLLAWAAGSMGQARGDDLDRLARELRSKYPVQINELAAWCDQRGLTAEAKTTRQWLGKRDANKLYVADLPRAVGRPSLPAGAPEDVVEWDRRFWELRRKQAGLLEAMARRAVRADRASLAFDLILSAIREYPDHEGIRRILGYQKFNNNWHTNYEIKKLKSGQVWDEKFGWLPAKYLARYQKGDRWSANGWVTAKEDAAMHRDIANGWTVETEHYAIRTNHSLEAGVQLGEKLEQLHRVWRQLFIRYYRTEAQVAELFDRRRIPPPLPRMAVVYFRDRSEYVRGLRAAFPDFNRAIVEKSEGVYIADTQRAYYFAGTSELERNIYHEATHQLFHQSRPVVHDVGFHANFWIVEGIAMYMETLHHEGECVVLGGADDPRMLAAHFRLLDDKFYVPLAQFTSLSRERFQDDPRIATFYTQAAGLTHFLVHYEEGRYRDALVGFLTTLYSGVDTPAHAGTTDKNQLHGSRQTIPRVHRRQRQTERGQKRARTRRDGEVKRDARCHPRQSYYATFVSFCGPLPASGKRRFAAKRHKRRKSLGCIRLSLVVRAPKARDGAESTSMHNEAPCVAPTYRRRLNGQTALCP